MQTLPYSARRVTEWFEHETDELENYMLWPLKPVPQSKFNSVNSESEH